MGAQGIHGHRYRDKRGTDEGMDGGTGPAGDGEWPRGQNRGMKGQMDGQGNRGMDTQGDEGIEGGTCCLGLGAGREWDGQMNMRVRVQDKSTWISLGTGSGTETDGWTEGLHTVTAGQRAARQMDRAMRNTGTGEQ